MWYFPFMYRPWRGADCLHTEKQQKPFPPGKRVGLVVSATYLE